MEEITNLQNYHSSELSALNAIVKLTAGEILDLDEGGLGNKFGTGTELLIIYIY